MAMAHGYYRTCGKPAAVMVHVTVGTANAICGLMNAARDNIPLLLAAGRTPITETGHIASRNRSIHWGQESFDQGGMVREFVKWDYELRDGQPVDAVVDRALDIAMSEPRGPVYLTLPREVLANPATHARRDTMRPLGVAAPEPARRVIEEARGMIAKAEFPLIVTSTIGRDPAGGDRARRARRGICHPGGAGRGARLQSADRPSDASRLRGRPLGQEGRRGHRARQRGAVDPGERRPAPRRQDHPHLGRSAGHPLSVPGDRGRPADRRAIPCAALRLLREALGAHRARPRTAPPTRRRKTVAAAREENVGQAQEADRDRQGPVAGPPRLARALPQRGEERRTRS